MGFVLRLYNNEKFCRCAARALLVFFIVYGSMRSFLSCFDITEYRCGIVTAACIVFAVYLSFIFYSEKRKNTMYLFLLLIFLIFTFFVGRYSNSGFYAIINIIYKKLEVEWDLVGIMEFTERYTNRYFTITVALVFITFGISVFANAVISNSMNFVLLFAVTAFPLLLAVYMGYMPNAVYAVMLITGYVSVYVLNRSGRFRYKSAAAKIHERYLAKKGRYYITRLPDGKMMLCVTAVSAVITVFVLAVSGIVFKDFYFYTGEKWQTAKNTADEYVKDFVTYGFLGMTNEYDAAGGVSKGKLGGVAAVRPDYQTDIVAEYTPYNFEPVYLRAYIGGMYTGRRWQPAPAEDPHTDNENYFAETELLKQAYNENDYKSAKGIMRITNVGADTDCNFLPYYTDNDSVDSTGMELNKEYYVEYYAYNPNVSIENDGILNDIYKSIPEKNVEAVRDFCDAAGIDLSDSTDDITKKMKAYFQSEYPYTMRPGKTPRNEDYVNYFLTTQKKGLCMHYASAAALVYRYLGIPARYVEGYTFSYGDVLNGELVQDESYDDWFDGYSEMGETGVVKVEINDIHAHAWTEIYDNEFGWKAVDLTPTTIGIEETGDRDFWDIFNRWMGEGDNDGGDEGDADDAGNAQNNISNGIVGFAEIIALIAAVLVLIIISEKIFKMLKFKRDLNKGGNEEKILKRYKYICSLARSADESFNMYTDHGSQLDYFNESCGTDFDDNSADIIERISYGKDEKITDDEYKNIMEKLLRLEKIISKKRKN